MTSGPASASTVGALVRGPGGVLGTVQSIALDPGDLRATWLVVRTTAGSVTAVPVMVASVNARDEVVVPFDGPELDGAPAVAGGVLAAATEQALLAHFGLAP